MKSLFLKYSLYKKEDVNKRGVLMLDQEILLISESQENIEISKCFTENEKINRLIDKSKVDMNEELEADFLLKIMSDNELL